MDQKQEQLNNLSEIRSLMERSSSFMSLSGLSGISAGIIGIISAFILDMKISPFLDYRKTVFLTAEHRTELIKFSLVVMTATLLLTFFFVTLFTALKAKKKGLSVWGPTAKRLLTSLSIPLVTGGLFCVILLINYFDNLVLPSMLIFYGLALVNASKYTLNEIFWLGLINVSLGLAATVFTQDSLILWGVGFGAMNILYGSLMYFKHER
jgi:hypothetical protein